MLYFHERQNDDGVVVRPVEEVLFYGKTRFQQITIVRVGLMGRILYINNSHQADDRFRQAYHRRMVSLVSLDLRDSAGSVAIVGGGPGGLALTCAQYFSNARIVEFEIDPQADLIYRQTLPDWGYEEVRTKHSDRHFRYLVDVADESRMADLPDTFRKHDVVFFDIDPAAMVSTSTRVHNRTRQECVSYEHILKAAKALMRDDNSELIATAGPCRIPDESQPDPYTHAHEVLGRNFPAGLFDMWIDTSWNFFHSNGNSTFPL